MVNLDRGHKTGRRGRRKLEVRDRLYRAAIELFRRYGYDATVVQQITEAADTAKGTFFTYFPTKEHVLAAYHDEMTARVLGRLHKQRRLDANTALFATAHACADWVVSDREMAGVVIRKLFGSPILAAADQVNGWRFQDFVCGVIERGVASGEFQADTDPRVFTPVFFAVLNTAVIDWVIDEHAFDLYAVLDERVGLLMRAILRQA